MHILLIEDEPRVAGAMVKSLESESFSVDLAADGEQGLQLLMDVDYEACVLDWNLPRIDGLTVLRQARKARAGVRMMIVSGRQALADRVCALESGADDFLAKPFAAEELLARMQALVRRPKRLVDTMRVEDLELDRTRHVVTRGGKLINLSQREYSVLEYLMRNAGRTVTRNMIVEHVWNLGFEGLTNIVDVYVNHLRDKIDRGFNKPLIRTKRGVGYRISSSD